MSKSPPANHYRLHRITLRYQRNFAILLGPAPLNSRPLDGRWMWVWLSLRGFWLRLAAQVVGIFQLGDASLALRVCVGEVNFVRPPWPPGAVSPALLH